MCIRDSVKIDISKSQNGITTIWLNNIHFKNFLKELWNTLQKTLDTVSYTHLDVYKRQLPSEVLKQLRLSLKSALSISLDGNNIVIKAQPCLLYTSRCV